MNPTISPVDRLTNWINRVGHPPNFKLQEIDRLKFREIVSSSFFSLWGTISYFVCSFVSLLQALFVCPKFCVLASSCVCCSHVFVLDILEM